jgi:hypothetical protein
MRYVSIVISPTRFPSRSLRFAASFAIVVVLPTPVGPRTDQRDDVRAVLLRLHDRSGNRQHALEVLRELVANVIRIPKVLRTHAHLERLDHLLRQFLRHLVLNQVQVMVEQFLRHLRRLVLAGFLHKVEHHLLQRRHVLREPEDRGVRDGGLLHELLRLRAAEARGRRRINVRRARLGPRVDRSPRGPRGGPEPLPGRDLNDLLLAQPQPPPPRVRPRMKDHGIGPERALHLHERVGHRSR